MTLEEIYEATGENIFIVRKARNTKVPDTYNYPKSVEITVGRKPNGDFITREFRNYSANGIDIAFPFNSETFLKDTDSWSLVRTLEGQDNADI